MVPQHTHFPMLLKTDKMIMANGNNGNDYKLHTCLPVFSSSSSRFSSCVLYKNCMAETELNHCSMLMVLFSQFYLGLLMIYERTDSLASECNWTLLYDRWLDSFCFQFWLSLLEIRHLKCICVTLEEQTIEKSSFRLSFSEKFCDASKANLIRKFMLLNFNAFWIYLIRMKLNLS